MQLTQSQISHAKGLQFTNNKNQGQQFHRKEASIVLDQWLQQLLQITLNNSDIHLKKQLQSHYLHSKKIKAAACRTVRLEDWLPIVMEGCQQQVQYVGDSQ
jgi:hypothetical protein